MKTEHAALWERIEAFAIDGDGQPAWPFVARLAHENRWSQAFAERVIREYKRYVFLCLTAGQPMCPSEHVDQAWHLHLTYTRSYWTRFCKETLGQPLHHEPTQGGPAEQTKHHAMYSATLQAYREAFGTDAPSDIWSPLDQRFGDDLAERRVNVRQYWLVPKGLVRRLAWSCVMLVGCVTFAAGCDGPGNPFAANGVAFLPYFFIAYAVAFVLAHQIRTAHRSPIRVEGAGLPQLDSYETAYLAGGIPRVIAVALVRLKSLNLASFDTNGKVSIHGVPRTDAEPIEKIVYEELQKQENKDVAIKPLGKAVQGIAATRFERLEDLRLRVSAAHGLRGRALPFLLMLLPFVVLGLPRVLLGLGAGKPSGYLIISVVVTTIISAIVFLRPIRRTIYGDTVVKNLERAHTDDLRTLTDHSPATTVLPAVAIFGTAALAGTSYAYMQDRMKPLDNAGTGGCSSTSGCGGGGCGGGGDGGGGGGGCGGCGGGGGD